jgi:hypothetical protein
MSISGQDEPRQQTFHGPGSFGGDNNGTINNNVLLDAKTKALVAKMAQYAPPLAGLLEKAIRDGVISPDVAEALMLAARNINEDVAEALRLAARNINEDVAADLRVAGANINEDVANKFVQVRDGLSDTAHDLENVLASLRKTVGQLGNRQGESNPGNQFGLASTVTDTAWRSGRMVTRPSPRSTDNWWFRVRLFCAGLGVGVLTGAILVHYRLVAYAVVAATVCLMLSALPWLTNALRRTPF